MTLTIVLPHPPSKLHPNGGKNWGYQVIASLTKRARNDAWLAATAAINAGSDRAAVPFAKAEIEAHFYFKRRATRDKDNFVGWIKAYLDGLADAGVVENDSDFEAPVPFEHVAKGESLRVELIVTEV